MFNEAKAIKRATRKVPDVDTAATTHTPPSSQPSTSAPGQMGTMPFTNMPPFPYQTNFPSMYMPPFAGFGMPYSGNPFPFFTPSPGTASVLTNALRQSPPSSPPTADCSIADFCMAYNLGERTEAGLEKLGFRFGDDLSTVTAEEYGEAGFKPLEWRRVLAAYRKLKQDTRCQTLA
jgi:hypothetical protein